MVSGTLRILCLFVLAAVLCGCRLTLDVDVDVAPDGGGTLGVSVTADAELEELAAAAGADPLGRLVDRVEALDSGWAADLEEGEGGSRTATLSVGFEDPAGFDRRYGELRSALDAPEARLLGPLSLSVDEDDDVLSVEGVLPLSVTEVAAADLGTDVAALTEQLAAAVDVSLQVTTPGRVLQTDASLVTVDGVPAAPPYPDEAATLSWVAVPGGEVPVSATFERGGPALLRLVAIGGAALLAVALIAGGILAQRRAQLAGRQPTGR